MQENMEKKIGIVQMFHLGHGFATAIFLSYTKVALISMKFIIPSSLYGSRAEAEFIMLEQ